MEPVSGLQGGVVPDVQLALHEETLSVFRQPIIALHCQEGAAADSGEGDGRDAACAADFPPRYCSK